MIIIYVTQLFSPDQVNTALKLKLLKQNILQVGNFFCIMPASGLLV